MPTTEPRTPTGRHVLEEWQAEGGPDPTMVAAILAIEREAFWLGVGSVEEVHQPGAAVNRLPLYEEALDALAEMVVAWDTWHLSPAETRFQFGRLTNARDTARSILSKLGRGIEESRE